MTRYVLSPTAKREIAEIWLYTADNWGVDQADRYVRALERDLEAAAMGSPLVQPIDQFWRIRSGQHLCVFERRDDGMIHIIRILHERMDVPRHLGA